MTRKSNGSGSLLTLVFIAAVIGGYAAYRSCCKRTAEVRAARADKARWENEGGPPRPSTED
jgi:hypothetical protein